METTSRKSRAIIHYQRQNSAGNIISSAACRSRGTHLVGIRFHRGITCESCKGLVQEDLAHDLRDVVVSMGLRSKAIAVYDNAQTAACGHQTYIDFAKAGDEDKADHYAHQQAIEAVRIFLIAENAITSQTAERVVNLAYTEIT